MSAAHLAVIEDRMRTTRDYDDWRAAEVGHAISPIPAQLHAAISRYGDARAAMALTTANGGLASASRAQELVALHYLAVAEEITLMIRELLPTKQEG